MVLMEDQVETYPIFSDGVGGSRSEDECVVFLALGADVGQKKDQAVTQEGPKIFLKK